MANGGPAEGLAVEGGAAFPVGFAGEAAAHVAVPTIAKRTAIGSVTGGLIGRVLEPLPELVMDVDESPGRSPEGAGCRCEVEIGLMILSSRYAP